MKLGQKIKKVRELRGFSQEYLGAKLNISQQYYSKLEGGTVDIEENLLTDIATILEVDRSQLENFDPTVIFNNHNQLGGNAANTINQNFPIELLDSFVKLQEHFKDIIQLLKSTKT